MKSIVVIVLATVLLSGCSKTPESPAVSVTPTASSSSPAPAASTATPAAKRASASGVVQSIDATAHTVTIAHGPVEALGWPGMTMTFQAPGIDLATLKPGDKVAFEFTPTGVDGRIDLIKKQ